METLKKYQDQITATVIVAMFPTIIVLAEVLDLCMHCPGH
tara:strand:+ start:51 stop:170 length:120 start_codon:yes stop_codon:yes gene_type:complete